MFCAHTAEPFERLCLRSSNETELRLNGYGETCSRRWSPSFSLSPHADAGRNKLKLELQLRQEHGAEERGPMATKDLAERRAVSRVGALAEQALRVQIGSSDGHDPEVVGCYFTEFPGVINTMGEFVKALRARTGRPGNRKNGPLTSGPVDVD